MHTLRELKAAQRDQCLTPAQLALACAAVRDPANADRPFAWLRVDLYHLLAKHDTPEVWAVFEQAIRDEDDQTAQTVTYLGWRLTGLVQRLPDLIRDAEACGDQRTLARLRALQQEAGY
jgi:hypothetical protein